MKRILGLSILVCNAVTLAACDKGPNGFGVAPAGVPQAEWDAEQKAKREAFYRCMSGPRPGGDSGKCYALKW